MERRGRVLPGRMVLLTFVVPLTAAAVIVGLVVGHGGGGGGGGSKGAGAPGAAAAGAVPPPNVDRFDSARAMRLTRLQLDAGPRPAGSRALRRLAVRLRALLPQGRFEDLPADPGMRNVVGEIPGTGPVIVVGAHYETKNTPKGFVGANDAAAAVGAVLELARDLQGTRRPAGAPAIRFVLFDGEEELAPTSDFFRDALRGSKAYVRAHAEEIRAMVLLDYIANPGLRLPREGTSNQDLWTRMRAAARRVGAVAVFPGAVGQSILDDHTPFLRAGIPAVDLIDWNWPYQHTLRDTYDKLSERSVDAVGETVLELLRTWR